MEKSRDNVSGDTKFVMFVTHNIIRLHGDHARKRLTRGHRVASKENAMPSYEIFYRKGDGTLAGKFSAMCEDEKKAKILAHAMRLEGTRTFEVWDGQTLVYARPQRDPASVPAA
jgi:hypothetical protein